MSLLRRRLQWVMEKAAAINTAKQIDPLKASNERLEKQVEQQEQRIAELEAEKRDGFCAHLEILCGDCTEEKGFAIWHQPPSCGERK